MSCTVSLWIYRKQGAQRGPVVLREDIRSGRSVRWVVKDMYEDSDCSVCSGDG